jgi:hypothetical protein
MEKVKPQKKSRRDKKRSKRSKKQKSHRSKRDDEVKCIPRPKYKVYCGNNDILPSGYNRFGKRFECLKKGFGVGSVVENKKLRREVILQGYDIDLYKYPEYCKN